MTSLYPDPILQYWDFTASDDEGVCIIPDGCRDIIVREIPGSRAETVSYQLDNTARSFVIPAGLRVRGVRYQPGAIVNSVALERWSQQHPTRYAIDEGLAGEFASLHVSTQAILEALAETGTSIKQAAKRLGTSPRTLQRHVASVTAASPVFWMQLARLRKAARALVNGMPVADVAFTFGYADQPHLSRAFKKWLGTTPGNFVRRSDLVVQIMSSGYD